DATFEVIKDGVGEMRAFAARGLPSSGAASPRHLLPEGEGISEAERERDAATGAAMPDGASSSGSAKDDYRSGQKSDVEAHIVARPEAIRALGAPPDDPTKPFGQSDAPLGAPEALARAAETLVDAARKLERAAEENARLTKALDGISPLVSDLAERVAKLEAQPMPARAALRSLSKSADGEADAASADEAIRRLQALPPEARALALTKLSLANPLRY
ncbi:MAG: hypothetical protein JO288_00845, partial [Hyphomicrobiales bacterium]|nr:hypothetical protein [Hyphomicrobiales bacterium]